MCQLCPLDPASGTLKCQPFLPKFCCMYVNSQALVTFEMLCCCFTLRSGCESELGIALQNLTTGAEISGDNEKVHRASAME